MWNIIPDIILSAIVYCTAGVIIMLACDDYYVHPGTIVLFWPIILLGMLKRGLVEAWRSLLR